MTYASFPGELFLRMMAGISMPLVCSSVVAAVGSTPLHVVVKVGGRALLLSLCAKLMAATTGVLVAYFLAPGMVNRLEIAAPPVKAPTSVSTLATDKVLDFLRSESLFRHGAWNNVLKTPMHSFV